MSARRRAFQNSEQYFQRFEVHPLQYMDMVLTFVVACVLVGVYILDSQFEDMSSTSKLKTYKTFDVIVIVCIILAVLGGIASTSKGLPSTYNLPMMLAIGSAILVSVFKLQLKNKVVT